MQYSLPFCDWCLLRVCSLPPSERFVRAARIKSESRRATVSTARVPLVAAPLSNRVPLVAASDPTTLVRLPLRAYARAPASRELLRVPFIIGPPR
eukprot:212132-Prorocentrum_minimum.AAC.1